MKLITLIIFLNIGLFKVNSCDCCNENKSSGSGSSAAKSGSPLIDINGKTIEKLDKLLIIGVCEVLEVHQDNFDVFCCFLKKNISNIEYSYNKFFQDDKIKVFFKDREGVGADIIIFVSSDVVSSLCLDTNNNKLHKLNDQIYYFYYLFFDSNDITIENNNITIENKDNVFAKLDISKLKWKD